LAPLLFLAYINELAEILANYGIKVNFFADDVKVYARITNDVNVFVLQEAMNALYSWAKDCLFRLRSVVCLILVKVSLMFQSPLTLPVVNSYRDLGVTVTSDLSPSLRTRYRNAKT